MEVWDSQSHPRQCNCTASKNELKFLKSIRQPLFSSFGKSEDQRWILPLMGCQCNLTSNNRQRSVPMPPFRQRAVVAGTRGKLRRAEGWKSAAIHCGRNGQARRAEIHRRQVRFQLLRRWLSCSSSSFFVSFLNDEQGRAFRTLPQKGLAIARRKPHQTR